MSTVYRIRKSFYIPFAFDFALFIILYLVILFGNSSAAEVMVFTVVFVPFLYVFLEMSARQVRISEEGVTIKKLFRTRRFGWSDITEVGALVLRKKIYLLITTTKGFYIITNFYDQFAMIVRDIVSHVDKERIEEKVAEISASPVTKIADVVSAWIAAALLAAVLALKILNW